MSPEQWRLLLRWGLTLILPLFIFALFIAMAGASPFQTYVEMLRNAAASLYGWGEVVVRAAPILLCALATAVPARAGLINVGAEGQFAMGALTTTVVAVFFGTSLPMGVALPLAALAGMLGGLLWALLAGVLKVWFRLNETISTLLLNYVAALFMRYIIHGALKDPASFNWPFSPPFTAAFRLPILGDSRMHVGVLIAVVAAPVIWYLIARTAWGFRLRVTGGNIRSAQRAGYSTYWILLGAMMVGGALAGLAGMIEVCGIEGRLRPTTGVGLGYIGFLAAWMGRHHSLWMVLTSTLLAMIAVSGDSLQIFASMPASSVNILTALVLMGVLTAMGRKQHA